MKASSLSSQMSLMLFHFQRLDAELQEWCSMPHVTLPIDPVHIFDGTLLPLTQEQQTEFREHLASRHLRKSSLCKGCLLLEGPRRIHRRSRDVDRATHCLHIDIALTQSVDGYYCTFSCEPLDPQNCSALEKMLAYFESLSFESFEITDSSRVTHLCSDCAGELTAPFFQRFRISIEASTSCRASKDAGCKVPLLIYSSTRILELCSEILCSVAPLCSVATQSTISTVWFPGSCTGSRS